MITSLSLLISSHLLFSSLLFSSLLLSYSHGSSKKNELSCTIKLTSTALSIFLTSVNRQELKPFRTFRQGEVVAYETSLPPQELSTTTHTGGLKYAKVVSYSSVGEEGFGLTRVLLKTAPTSTSSMLSSEIFSFKVLCCASEMLFLFLLSEIVL